MGEMDDYVLDLHYANWLWEYVRSRTRIYWPDDERLTYRYEAGLETKRWYRDGTWDRHSWEEWQESTDFGVPDFVGSPRLDFIEGRVRNVYLAGITYTVIGSWYTFEATEDEDGPAEFDPIRLPVTREMVPEAKEWARDRGGEFVREKDVEFKERFATALDGDEAFQAAAQLNDVHVTVPDVTTEQEAQEIFREATEMAERAVRQVM